MSESYRVLLGRPSARPLIAALSAAWFSFGMVGLALILMTHRATGSFGLAGVVVASFSLGASAFAPIRGRLLDRHGTLPWLVVFATGYGMSLVLFAVVASAKPIHWLVALCAAGAGISAPPLIATIRGAWSSAVEPSLLRRAYALTALTGDVGLVVAPALCSVLFTVAPWSPLIVSAISALVGAVIVACGAPSNARRTEPNAAVTSPLAGSAMRVVLVVSVALGAAAGLVQVAVPAEAARWGAASSAGFLLGALALGSVVGGLWFGRRDWQRSAQERYFIASFLLALTFAPLLLAVSPGTLAALLFVAGLGYGPATISLFEALDTLAPEGTTEAFTWVTTAEAVGIAGGAAVSGWAFANLGSWTPFAAASIVLGGVAAGTFAWHRRSVKTSL
jgi:MFS family permease